MNKLARLLTLTAVIAVSLSPLVARAADEGPLEVRLRAIYLDPANKSDAYLPLEIPQNAVHINGKWLPDFDVEYFITPNWSSELVLTYPQSQTVTVEKSVLGGPTVLGTFKHLPPVLTAKYNFAPEAAVRPYVGLGINVTLISNVDLTVPGVGGLRLDSMSIGPAAQAGVDVKLAEHWFFNADIKWAQIRSDVKFDGSKISAVHIDPLLFGIGVGYRF